MDKNMILDLNYLKSKYNIKIKGVIHIGAHHCDEFGTYKQIGIENIMCFEPLPHNFERLKNNVDKNTLCYQLALGNEKKKIEMNVEYDNRSMSSSLLKPKEHLKYYPHIKFTHNVIVDMDKLDNIEFDRNLYNFINIDVQGYELEVFKGSINTLKNIDFIMSEINHDELYEKCVIYNELDDFLYKFNFERVETFWTDKGWGDAFYIKIK